MDRKQIFALWYMVLALIALVTLQEFIGGNHTQTLIYGEFKQALAAGRIDDIVLKEVMDQRMLDELLRAVAPDTGAEASLPAVAA